MALFQSTFINKWSALEWACIESRHKDLVYLVHDNGKYSIYSSKRITQDEIKKMEGVDVILCIAQGQISRQMLDVGELSFCQEELNRIRRD